MQKTYKKYFALFVLPTLIAFTLFFIVPFIMGIVLSFEQKKADIQTIRAQMHTGLELQIM